MLLISEYAQKLNKFFKETFSNNELRYKINVQLNFSLDVSLYVSDEEIWTWDMLKNHYENWLYSTHNSENLSKEEYHRRSHEECETDFKVYAGAGSVNFYIKPFGEIGDPYNEGNESGIEWGPRLRLKSFDYTIKERDKDLPAVVTFYSYKGGMGRTTTMMGFALWLASHNRKVAIIDCDLEAPGYLNFFRLQENPELAKGLKNGFVEFVADNSFMQELEISDYCVIPNVPENIPNRDEKIKMGTVYDNIVIVPGGNLNDAYAKEFGEMENETEEEFRLKIRSYKNREQYIQGLSRINLSSPSSLLRQFHDLICKLKDAYGVEIVLIDSRTGFNDIYGSAAFSLSDHVVSFFGYSNQTEPGLRQLMDSYRRSCAKPETCDLNTNLILEPTFDLTICNSILPEVSDMDANPNMADKWTKFRQEFNKKISIACEAKQSNLEDGGEYYNILEIKMPSIFPVHRRRELEELGLDENADIEFFKLLENNALEDYIAIFENVEEALLKRGLLKVFKIESDVTLGVDSTGNNLIVENCSYHSTDTSVYDWREDYSSMRPLALTKIILRSLKEKLSNVTNFAEDSDLHRETFLYRDCMADIFDSRKFIVRGFKGAGKTCIYQALGKNREITDFIKQRVQLSRNSMPSSIETDVDFVNVLDFDGISDHPLTLLETEGVFEDNRYFNFNGMWKILLWNSIFSNERYRHLLNESEIRDYTFNCRQGAETLLHIKNKMLTDENSLRVQSAIERDMRRLNEYLANNGRRLFVMYDGLDTIIRPSHWGRAISPLINSWKGNLNAYSNIHPKVFVRTDLFERIEGTNTERLRDNIMDIDWTIEDVFGYIFKLILGENKDNPSRQAIWQILRKLRPEKAENMIENIDRSIYDGKGQLLKKDNKTLFILVEIFFGKKVNPGTAQVRHPWEYFEKELANAAGKISLRPFIRTMSQEVLDLGIANNNAYVKEILPSRIYASREVRISVAESYFNDMASEKDFSDYLQNVRDYIHSDEGSSYRKKILSEPEFNAFVQNVLEIHGVRPQVIDTVTDLKQLLYASGLMKEVYRPGKKIYRFASMYDYAWGLKSNDSYTERNRPTPRTQNDIRNSEGIPQDGCTLEGVLMKNEKNKFTVRVFDGGNRPFYYECEQYVSPELLNHRVKFEAKWLPDDKGRLRRMSINVRLIED